MQADFRLLKRHKLRKKYDFQRLQYEGRKLFSKHFLLVLAPSACENSRLGVAITTKIEKNATKRNKLKRRLRELFRLNRERLSKSVDLLIIARKSASECDFNELKREILGALHYGGFLR